MVVDQYIFIRELLFFVNKHIIFVFFSEISFLFFAGPILINNIFYKNSFIFCQIISKNNELFLDNFLNMQLTSRNPFSGQIIAN
jgi:hypothetical protein